ncbi:MAG: hypothetical protein QOF44_1698 [Streptomyces sp.]|nr:hypothetical protein [Streptomyces sp.]
MTEQLGEQGDFVGRKPESALLRQLYGDAGAGRPRLVVVEGPAGIGKTALVRRFLAESAAPRVMSAGGAENEATLPYGVLGRLVDDGRGYGDPLAAGSRLLEAVGELQSRGPVVLVVDDVHWADAPSLYALAFALRRLRADQLLAVLTVRNADDRRLPEGLRRVLADDTTVRMPLGGLTLPELTELALRIGRGPLPPGAAARLHAHTRGNPLHCRALLEQLPDAVLGDTATPLPAPHSYTLFVLDRLAHCARPTRDLVGAAGVLGTPCPLDAAARLAGLDDDEMLAGLDEAVAHGLLSEERHGCATVVAFPHPLVRAAVYHGLGPVRRTELHTRAAETADGEFARLHHRVLAAHGPDARLAAELADHARPRARGGLWAEAATLLHDASRLAVPGAERGRLAVEAVEALLMDGRVDEAVGLVEALPAGTPPAARRYAEGYVAVVQGHNSRGATLLDEAWRLDGPGADPALAARIAARLAYAELLRGHGALAREWAETALRASDGGSGSGLLRYCHLIALGLSGAGEEGLARTDGLPAPALVPREDADLLLGRGMLHLWSDRLAVGHSELQAATVVLRQGPGPMRVLAVTLLGQAEYRLGRWDEAVTHLEFASSIAIDGSQVWFAPMLHAEAAVVLTARGDFDRAAGHVRIARASPDHTDGTDSAHFYAARAQAFLATVRGEPAEAVAALRSLTACDLTHAVNAPGCFLWRDLLADALVACEAYDEAEAVLAVFEELALAGGCHSDLSAVCRVRGNLHAARHEPKAAQDAYAEGIEHAVRAGYPFHRARAELDFGVFLRRAGRRTTAKQHLREARVLLAELGAVPFLKTCDRELAVCGVRPDGAPASPPRDGLTPQEHAVAQLAATGLTNRQVARELILSVKTVEYHLSHAYAKLGIGSRMGLVEQITSE